MNTQLGRKWVALPIWIALALPAPAFAGFYSVSRLALEGDAAPGTDGVYGTFEFMLPQINELGKVAFVSIITGGTVTYGAFRGDAGGIGPIAVVGDIAPVSGAAYAFLGGMPPGLNGSGQVSFLGVTPGGSLTHGLFLDSGDDDTLCVAPGSPAPDTTGTYTATPAELDGHALNAAGDVVFASGVSAGTPGSGIFLASAGGDTSIALQGEPAPGTGGGTYATLIPPTAGRPSMNASGTVVFLADVSGGTATSGIFRSVGPTDSAVALQGESAPGTGGGSYDLLLMPALGNGGHVAFFAGATAGSAAGGLFVDAGGTDLAAAVEFGAAPGTGGGTYTGLSSLPAVNGAGAVPFSVVLTGGNVAAGIFLFDAATGETSPVLFSGEVAPDTGGQTFDSFGYLTINDAGQIATVASLSGGGSGLFLLQPTATVPALPGGGAIALGVALAWAAGLYLRGRSGLQRD